ncbi:unnamed protein product, partial [Meganyctiphanes norvegica]
GLVAVVPGDVKGQSKGLVAVVPGDVKGQSKEPCFGLGGYVEVEDVFGGGPPKCFRFVEEQANYETQKYDCKLDGLYLHLNTHLATQLDEGGWLINLNYYINAHPALKEDYFYVDGTDAGGHEGL